jgi:hypothetical protein
MTKQSNLSNHSVDECQSNQIRAKLAVWVNAEAIRFERRLQCGWMPKQSNSKQARRSNAEAIKFETSSQVECRRNQIRDKLTGRMPKKSNSRKACRLNAEAIKFEQSSQCGWMPKQSDSSKARSVGKCRSNQIRDELAGRMPKQSNSRRARRWNAEAIKFETSSQVECRSNHLRQELHWAREEKCFRKTCVQSKYFNLSRFNFRVTQHYWYCQPPLPRFRFPTPRYNKILCSPNNNSQLHSKQWVW